MMNILVLCDDFWHPGEVVRMGLDPLEGREFHFTYVMDAKDILTPAFLRDYPVIVNCKSNNLNGANNTAWFEEGVAEVCPAQLRDYIESGGGFLSIHSGNAFMADDPSGYTDLVGNHFITHPPRCDVGIKITGRHPVTEGVADFTVRDEHYEIAMRCRDGVELFRTESATGGNQMGGYVRTLGGGRICVFTPGHILGAWRHPMYQKLVGNAIRWCGGK